MSSNEKIIIEEAVKHGLISEVEGELALIYHTDIGLHTPTFWKEHYNRFPRKGESGIPVKLWKKMDEKYVLVKSNLFTKEQVEVIAD